MPKKNDVDELSGKLVRLNERAKSAEEELIRLEEKRKKVQNLISEEERKKRTHNLCGIGGIVYKYFGENLTPEEFKDMLDFLIAIDEVQDFVTNEKEKRFLLDNQPVIISENTNSDENTFESENVTIENA